LPGALGLSISIAKTGLSTTFNLTLVIGPFTCAFTPTIATATSTSDKITFFIVIVCFSFVSHLADTFLISDSTKVRRKTRRKKVKKVEISINLLRRVVLQLQRPDKVA